jgi:hypothetical protein
MFKKQRNLIIAKMNRSNFYPEFAAKFEERRSKESKSYYKTLNSLKFKSLNAEFIEGVPGFRKRKFLGTTVKIFSLPYGIHLFDDNFKEYAIPWSLFTSVITNDEVKDGVWHNMGKAGMTGMMTTGSTLGSFAAGATMGNALGDLVVGKEGFLVIQFRQIEGDDFVNEAIFKTKKYKKIKEEIISQRQNAVQNGILKPSNSTSSPVDKNRNAVPDKLAMLEKLNELRIDGALNDEEFQAEKQKILGQE